MRRVILESPYAGNIRKNLRYARRAMADCLFRGEAPVASHLLYPQALDDNDPGQRQLGIGAGFEWWEAADAVVFYVDLGMSPGMRAAFERAIELRLPVEIRRLTKARNTKAK